MKLLAPSMLSADFANLGADIAMVNSSNADWFHLDIMDGVFVPNISYGLPVVERIHQLARKPLDVHLMIVDPDRYLERFCNAGASWLTVHYEACTHLHRTLAHIRSLGVKSGVALNPHTPVEMLTDVIQMADMVLVMSVNPGFGGQKFIPQTLAKVRRLKALIQASDAQTLIQVDGGVDANNAAQLYDAGVDILVAGSAVFKADNPVLAIDNIKFAKK